MPPTSPESIRRRARTIGRPETFYPSPFFDIARQYIPDTIKETFEWCLYYQLTNPIINAVTSKLAAYPITNLVYETENLGETEAIRGLLEKIMNLRMFLVETNLDRYTYGNSFATVAFPIAKVLICKNCDAEKKAKSAEYTWRGYKFHIVCDSCGGAGEATTRDEPIKAPTKIKLIRWNPKQITLKTNEITGEVSYYYAMPAILRNQITLGKPEVIENLPQAFIDAVAKKKAIRLDSAKVFHTKRPSASRNPTDTGWGAPLILPVLKDVFFLQILRKSQEAVAMEHIVPMRVMFPQITADGNNPYTHVNLADWQKEVKHQISKWRWDANYIPVMPVPIGHQVIGGQGKAYLLHQEIRIYSEQIIAGMGVPTGFFYGEAMYSGASVNLRALENEFMGNREDMLRLVEFIRDQVCTFLGLPKTKVSFKPFKMADDLQRAAFDFQLVMAKKLSSKTFLQGRSFDPAAEKKLIAEESEFDNVLMRKQIVAQAEAAGEGQLQQAKYQQKVQEMTGVPVDGQPPPQEGEAAAMPPEQAQPNQVPPEAMGGQSPITQTSMQPGGYVDMQTQVASIVDELNSLGMAERYQALTTIRNENPAMYELINAGLHLGAPGSRLKPLPSITGEPIQ